MLAAMQPTGSWELQIVKRSDKHRFVVLPKRWIVERTLGWTAITGGWRGIANAMPIQPPPSSASP